MMMGDGDLWWAENKEVSIGNYDHFIAEVFSSNGHEFVFLSVNEIILLHLQRDLVDRVRKQLTNKYNMTDGDYNVLEV